MSTTISNPVSFTSTNPGSVVSGLEDALMKSIGQGMQSGQSTDSASVQQEMQLLTELLNQPSNSEGTPSPTSSSDPSNSGALSTGSDPSASSDPSTRGSSSTGSNGIDKPERKLERALERNVTDRLEKGQSPNNGNALEQEMNLLIQLLGQGA